MKPWLHQQREYDMHRFDKARALLWQPRTGKTKAIIDAACAMWLIGDIDCVIVVAPNGVHRNWTVEQLPKHCTQDYDAMAWRFSDKKNVENFNAFMSKSAFYSSLPWLTINLESLIREEVTKAIAVLRRKFPRFLLVVDESHHFAKPGSKRTFAVRSLARHANATRILTGTSVEDSPLQAYSQFEILEKGALGHTTYEDFKDEFVRYEKQYGRHYEIVKEYVHMDKLSGRMAKYSSVVLRAECVDLPELQYITQTVELPGATRDLYHKIKKGDPRTLFHLGFSEEIAGAALLTKLQQIETGWLITPNGTRNVDTEFSALAVALEEIAEYRCIVFCEFLHDIDCVHRELSHRTGKRFGCVSGQHTNRTAVIAEFQDGKLDGLLIQSHAGSEGYELSVADKILWYSQTHTARVRVQGNERATSMSGKAKQIVDLIVPNGVNAYYRELTTRKTNLADDISRQGLKAILERLDI